jgi:transcriptional regulator with XRE-family HTH domain
MKKTTAERLREVMDRRGLKQADIVRLCQPYAEKLGIKFQKSALSQYLSGRNEPNQYKLTVLALALNVSEAWLMGYDVPMERKEITTDNLTDGEQLLLTLFRQFPKELQDAYLVIFQATLKNRK